MRKWIDLFEEWVATNRNGFEIFFNPSMSEFQKNIREWGDARAFCGYDDLYIFDASLIHDQAKGTLLAQGIYAPEISLHLNKDGPYFEFDSNPVFEIEDGNRDCYDVYNKIVMSNPIIRRLFPNCDFVGLGSANNISLLSDHNLD